MKTKHTPGPWRFQRNYEDRTFHVIGPRPCDSVSTDVPNIEDARLIAAAPDLLLAALNAFMTFNDSSTLTPGEVEALDRLLSAVRKATVGAE